MLVIQSYNHLGLNLFCFNEFTSLSSENTQPQFFDINHTILLWWNNIRKRIIFSFLKKTLNCSLDGINHYLFFDTHETYSKILKNEIILYIIHLFHYSVYIIFHEQTFFFYTRENLNFWCKMRFSQLVMYHGLHS